MDLKAIMRQSMQAKTKYRVMLDSVTDDEDLDEEEDEDEQPKGKRKMIADAVKANAVAVHQERQIAQDALELFYQWINTDESDLPEGDGYGDHLYTLMVSLADDNKDGEISDDEAEIVGVGLEAVAEYAISKGVDEDEIISLLEDFDNDTAENVRELLLGLVPEDDDEFQDEMNDIVFSASENESLLDGATLSVLDSIATANDLSLDAAYRKTFVIRNGKKKRINKRISGRVVLSAKRKQALRKAQRKAHKGTAKIKRLKSFRMRKRLGMNK